MNPENLSELFEICLSRLRAGESPESILADYPQEQANLLPLLQIAASLSVARPAVAPLLTAQSRSKARMLQAASSVRSPRPGLSAFFARLSFSAVLSLFLVVVFLGVVGINIAAAEALPGDPLYSVKIANERSRLIFAPDDQTRLKLHEEFNQRRLDEVEKLLKLKRQVEVKFEGTLTFQSGAWRVAGFLLDLPAKWLDSPLLMTGVHVEVRGVTQPDGSVLVTELRLEKADDDDDGEYSSDSSGEEDRSDSDSDDDNGITPESTRTAKPDDDDNPDSDSDDDNGITPEYSRTPTPDDDDNSDSDSDDDD